MHNGTTKKIPFRGCLHVVRLVHCRARQRARPQQGVARRLDVEVACRARFVLRASGHAAALAAAPAPTPAPAPGAGRKARSACGPHLEFYLEASGSLGGSAAAVLRVSASGLPQLYLSQYECGRRGAPHFAQAMIEWSQRRYLGALRGAPGVSRRRGQDQAFTACARGAGAKACGRGGTCAGGRAPV